MALSLCGKRVLLTNSILRQSVRHQGYIVLIPEIGEDLPEKNPLLQQNGLPEFNNITIENCIAAIGKQTLDFESDVRSIESKIVDNPPKDVFREIFEPLEVQGAPLDMTWGLAKTLYLGNSSLMPTKTYMAIHERARRARAAKFNSKPILEYVLKETDENKGSRSPEQDRLIKKFALEGKLNGLLLSETERSQLETVLNKLMKEKQTFKAKTEVSTKKFSHAIEDPIVIKELPQELVFNLCESPQKALYGPWKVTLKPTVYLPFMEYCPEREIRWNVWQAMVGRGSGYANKEYETSTHLESIRTLRRDQAKLLGYETFADMSMETKMAGSVANVEKMLEMLLEKARPAQERELESLQAFASERKFEGARIELWDVPFWRRKQRRTLFDYNEEEYRKYFPVPKVLDGLFALSEKLFNIQIRQRPNVSTWHKDIKFYDVFESHSEHPIGGFYLDLYADSQTKLQQQNGWMIGIQNKSRVAETNPLAALVFNFRTPSGTSPSTLSFKEVTLLFHKFGNALQHLLSRTSYSEVSGLSNIEWDAVQVSGYVLSHFLQQEDVIRSITSHVSSEDTLPTHMFESLRKMNQHAAGIDLCRELYLSALDLELHSTKDFWLDVVKRLWPIYRAFPLDKYDAHPCSFTKIFCEEWAAAYFCQIWARVLAADAYGAFHEVKGDEKSTLDVGKRFRDTFLALGGGCHPAEVFRKFRGRDPSPNALLSSLGLKSKVGQSS